MKTVEIFTDGSCFNNPGPGGWGALLRFDTVEKKIYGGEPDTTNNRMELQAAIEALASLKEPCKIDLTTDSQYVRQGITQWIHNWIRRGWRTASKQPVKNADLWQTLLQESERHDISWHWVRGHQGHRENEIADDLAKKGAIEASQRRG